MYGKSSFPVLFYSSGSLTNLQAEKTRFVRLIEQERGRYVKNLQKRKIRVGAADLPEND